VPTGEVAILKDKLLKEYHKRKCKSISKQIKHNVIIKPETKHEHRVRNKIILYELKKEFV
jgi:hypothetical protein